MLSNPSEPFQPTLPHYLELLSAAGMVVGLAKYAVRPVRQRASSPKLQVLNTALITAQSELGAAAIREDRVFWGRLVESAIGAHLANAAAAWECKLYDWRERNHEVDFVAKAGKNLAAIEVKSGADRAVLPGMAAFRRAFKVHRSLLVGGDGIPVEEFLSGPVGKWLSG